MPSRIFRASASDLDRSLSDALVAFEGVPRSAPAAAAAAEETLPCLRRHSSLFSVRLLAYASCPSRCFPGPPVAPPS